MTKTFTLVLGVVLLGVGVVGAFTGGHDHELIVFGINMTHNLVHILSGAVAIACALAGAKAAKMYCLVFGLVYGAVTVAGFLNVEQAITLLNLNTADNYLHLAIAATSLYFGVVAKA